MGEDQPKPIDLLQTPAGQRVLDELHQRDAARAEALAHADKMLDEVGVYNRQRAAELGIPYDEYSRMAHEDPQGFLASIQTAGQEKSADEKPTEPGGQPTLWPIGEAIKLPEPSSDETIDALTKASNGKTTLSPGEKRLIREARKPKPKPRIPGRKRPSWKQLQNLNPHLIEGVEAHKAGKNVPEYRKSRSKPPRIRR